MKADWVSLSEAVRLVTESILPVGAEDCQLHQSRGRVLAEDLVSPIDLPLWTNSAMDGFAVRAVDIAGASAERPVELPVSGEVRAGGFPGEHLQSGSAVRIMTGAAVPEGADSVVRIEHTDGGHSSEETLRVRIYNSADSGKNLRRRGEEISAGMVALFSGEVLSPASIGVAASLGRSSLRVHKRPAVALLTSGDELVHVDRFDEVRAGRKIVSSNSYTLAAALEEIGCDVRYLGIAQDREESLREALEGARGCDALVTSAGISVGEHDYIRRVLLGMGAQVLFWRIRMRPGSPFAFGHIEALGGIPWFGLPGNPVSTAVTFELLARPALRRLCGARRPFKRAVLAALQEDYSGAEGLTNVVRVILEGEAGDVRAKLTGAQGSGMLTSMARADGLMIIPEAEPNVSRGQQFPVLPLNDAGFGQVFEL